MEEIIKLKEKAKMLEDVRQKNKKVYKIWDIVVVVILAVLSDCNEWSEIEDFAYERKDFLKKYLKLTGGIPTAKTYERVIGLIDSNELNKIFIEFCQRIQEPKAKEFKEILSFDGKIENGSSRKKGLFYNEMKPLNVLNVYSDKLEMCIDQEMIEDKTNEIPTVKKIIERLELKNVICTWDALNTQKSNVKAVVDKKGEYVVPIKKNHERFYKELEDYFEEDRLKIIESGYEGSYSLTREKSHSSIITYEYYQTEKVKWYEDYKEWEKLKSFGIVKKTIEKSDGNRIVEKRYYISSLLLDINNFSNAIRKHWNVENKLHWQMDFTFKSDDNRTKILNKSMKILQQITYIRSVITMEQEKAYEIYTDASFDNETKIGTYAIVIIQEKKVIKSIAKKCNIQLESSTECKIFAIFRAINIIEGSLLKKKTAQKFWLRTDCSVARDFFIEKNHNIKIFERNEELLNTIKKSYNRVKRRLAKKDCSFKLKWIPRGANKIAHKYSYSAFQKLKQANYKKDIILIEKESFLELLQKFN